MRRLATTKIGLSRQCKHETALVGSMISTKVLRDHVRSAILALGGVIALSASAVAQSPAAPNTSQADLDSLSRDPSQWVMAPHDASTRFSSLDQINAGNAAQLQLAWTFSVGADRGQEAAPLIVNNTMYVVGPYAPGRLRYLSIVLTGKFCRTVRDAALHVEGAAAVACP